MKYDGIKIEVKDGCACTSEQPEVELSPLYRPTFKLLK
jgi:hypothetical protein